MAVIMLQLSKWQAHAFFSVTFIKNFQITLLHSSFNKTKREEKIRKTTVFQSIEKFMIILLNEKYFGPLFLSFGMKSLLWKFKYLTF